MPITPAPTIIKEWGMARLSRASRLSMQTGDLAQSGITGLDPVASTTCPAFIS